MSKEHLDRLVEDDTSSDSSSISSLELVIDKRENEERNADHIQENNIYDFDLETVRDKPWLKPGADITDYFNYGFTESTWAKYCAMQRENREFARKYSSQNNQGGAQDTKQNNNDTVSGNREVGM